MDCELCGENRELYTCKFYDGDLEFILDCCAECVDIESLRLEGRIEE